MNLNFSKAEIDRLGTKIRTEKASISEDTLSKLQIYRRSHKETLSKVFDILCCSSKKIYPKTIITYRIKRFESIISKLQRYPDMRFSRMWDIGGCRCILRNNDDVYKLFNLIKEEDSIEIIKIYDYIETPQRSGYKSFHLFVKLLNDERIIEVQIRNEIDHNWSTLVEITDLLFDTKLKELGENNKLFTFHYLLSKAKSISIEDKKEIVNIIKIYNYHEKLSDVFSRNHLKVRHQWLEIDSKINNKYFLIEATKNETPKIESFQSFQEAENKYFEQYKNNQYANIVLTHLYSPNYKQISIAYSNYILTFHSFLDECFDIIESLVFDALQRKEYLEFYRNLKLYYTFIYQHLFNFKNEIIENNKVVLILNEKNRKRDKRKEKEWKKDIDNQIEHYNKRIGKFNKLLNYNMNAFAKHKFKVFIIKQLMFFKFKKKFRKLFER